ncbi:YncE family protein [Paraburkholderia pallida]|uniref:YncE family protein n=1 Tax=Paraburkholderia pallida TaxID=2547399 RepID=UPI0018D8BCAF|nr:hypothetical protein [Paraburkholderia pallida]
MSRSLLIHVMAHNGKILVCVTGADYVAEVDPLTGNVLRRLKTGNGPHNLFLTPERNTLYVTNRVGGSLAALDASTLELRRTWTELMQSRRSISDLGHCIPQS